MRNLKDTQRSCVEFDYDGTIHKHYAGPSAEERFRNEARVLYYLEEKGCDFVPKIIDIHEDTLELVMTNCGEDAPLISDQKRDFMFRSLEETYGVKHDDPFTRNITYNYHTGGFNVIDFEYATILETGEGFTISEEEEIRHTQKYIQTM